MKKEPLMKIDLQFFAEPDPEPEPDNDKQDPKDDSITMTQSELDAEINKANQKAIDNAKKGMVSEDYMQQQIQDAIKKAEDDSELTDKEKEQKRKDEKTKELEDKIAEYQRKEKVDEQIKEAKSTLDDKGITEFEPLLSQIITDDEEANQERIEAFAEGIQSRDESIKNDLQKQLGTRSILDGNSSTSATLGEQFAKQANQQQTQQANDPWKTN